jgi:uracil-DNA glycosylase family 4
MEFVLMRVEGYGPIPCDFLILGEKPDEQSARRGIPFTGKTGDELKRYFNGDDLPDLADVYRTTLYREYLGKDYEHTRDDLEHDEPELLSELASVQPSIIVAVGREAVRWCLGDVDLEETHGLPWHLPADSPGFPACSVSGSEVYVFPTYHPAAGFRSPEASALVAYDFGQLALFAQGELKPRRLYDDPIPNPCYTEIVSPGFLDAYRQFSEIALDTEGSPRRPWSAQFSHVEGFGFLLQSKNLTIINAFLEWVCTNRTRLIFHSALHDRPMLRALARLCKWTEGRILLELDTLPFGDTMVMSYLLQMEPQGLKGLATRLCNMQMMSYDEVLGDANLRQAVDHYLIPLYDVCNYEYELEQQEEFARINKTPLVDKLGKPKRNKDGSIRYRSTKVLPKLPKSPLFKAVERCLGARNARKLWSDQTEDIRDAGYRIQGEMPEASLSHVEFPTALRYSCRDTDATIRVNKELSARIKALGLESTYALELGTYPLIDRMATVGLKPDLKIFKALSQKLDFHIADLQVRLENTVGKEGFNANSGDQVADYLFHQLELPPIKMTGNGRESTNDKILEALEKEHGHEFPAISDIREYRETFKLKNTFVDRIPDFVRRYPFDGRIHATFRTTRVITGRLAASDPNILAQPEHGKFAKDFKAGWVAEDGHVLCNWDLSQIELRVLAHLSQDPVLLEAYRFECPHRKEWKPGKPHCKRNECVLRADLHARLAHMVFGKQPSEQDDSKHRLPAKTHNFGLAMGMTCYGLMVELRKNGVDVDEQGAQEWIDASNRLYAKVPIYKAEKIAEARRHGFVRCLSGRIRYIGGIRSWDERLRSEAERFAFSTPIQEGAQWLMKQAEASIWNEILMPRYRDGFYKGGPRGRWVEPLVQIHDAIKMEVADGLQGELNTQMQWAMTKAPTQISVPLAVEGKCGINFRDMKGF